LQETVTVAGLRRNFTGFPCLALSLGGFVPHPGATMAGRKETLQTYSYSKILKYFQIPVNSIPVKWYHAWVALSIYRARLLSSSVASKTGCGSIAGKKRPNFLHTRPAKVKPARNGTVLENKTQQAVIIGFIENRDFSSSLYAFARGAVESGALLICADGGGEVALAWDLTPDLLVGDMDSISPQSLETLTNRPGVEVRIVPAEKDETDLELALLSALERGAKEITILGGLGGRLDHTLGNIYLLAAPQLDQAGAKARLLAEQEEIFVIRGGQTLELAGQPGDILSLLPLTPAATGIQTENLYYPLRREPLYIGPTRGISNVFTAQTASVTFEDGLLLVIHRFGPA
jgi:thiamine pyrophosphokinase